MLKPSLVPSLKGQKTPHFDKGIAIYIYIYIYIYIHIFAVESSIGPVCVFESKIGSILRQKSDQDFVCLFFPQFYIFCIFKITNSVQGCENSFWWLSGCQKRVFKNSAFIVFIFFMLEKEKEKRRRNKGKGPFQQKTENSVLGWLWTNMFILKWHF